MEFYRHENDRYRGRFMIDRPDFDETEFEVIEAVRLTEKPPSSTFSSTIKMKTTTMEIPTASDWNWDFTYYGYGYKFTKYELMMVGIFALGVLLGYFLGRIRCCCCKGRRRRIGDGDENDQYEQYDLRRRGASSSSPSFFSSTSTSSSSSPPTPPRPSRSHKKSKRPAVPTGFHQKHGKNKSRTGPGHDSAGMPQRVRNAHMMYHDSQRKHPSPFYRVASDLPHVGYQQPQQTQVHNSMPTASQVPHPEIFLPSAPPPPPGNVPVQLGFHPDPINSPNPNLQGVQLQPRTGNAPHETLWMG